MSSIMMLPVLGLLFLSCLSNGHKACNDELCSVERLDAAFVIDTSHSLPNKDFGLVKKLGQLIVRYLIQRGISDLRFGLIEFAEEGEVNYWLDSGLSRKAAVKKFEDMEKSKNPFGTNAELPLYIARTQMLNATFGAGARYDVQKAIVIITDGPPSSTSNALHEAQVAQNEGIMTFVIATGLESGYKSSLDSARLMAGLYTGNRVDRVFRVGNNQATYDDFSSAAVVLVRKICTELQKASAGNGRRFKTLSLDDYKTKN